jgi:hypothetical protein
LDYYEAMKLTVVLDYYEAMETYGRIEYYEAKETYGRIEHKAAHIVIPEDKVGNFARESLLKLDSERV